ncbi:hypothetical protein N7522_005027 [Penicillium canescens]|nr:hypothetical protein N7522_005027 [Penicillium canescens]
MKSVAMLSTMQWVALVLLVSRTDAFQLSAIHTPHSPIYYHGYHYGNNYGNNYRYYNSNEYNYRAHDHYRSSKSLSDNLQHVRGNRQLGLLANEPTTPRLPIDLHQFASRLHIVRTSSWNYLCCWANLHHHTQYLTVSVHDRRLPLWLQHRWSDRALWHQRSVPLDLDQVSTIDLTNSATRQLTLNDLGTDCPQTEAPSVIATAAPNSRCDPILVAPEPVKSWASPCNACGNFGMFDPRMQWLRSLGIWYR